jgi:hypothetical protein
MDRSTLVNVYDSRSAAYQRAFQVFLDHTDQKARARDWLDLLVRSLPARDLFVDAGAGNGKVTAWFTDQFQRTVAIEPNPHLCEELRRTCPTAEVLPETILAAQPPTSANLVLCSHVFAYLPRAEWMLHLESLASWLGSGGVLVVALQNHQTDCTRMLDRFLGLRFNLSELASQFQAARGDDYEVELETVPAQVVTTDFEAAYTVAEFMLNVLPIAQPPARGDLEAYVREHLAAPGGGYRFSCDQDFLQIRPRPLTRGGGGAALWPRSGQRRGPGPGPLADHLPCDVQDLGGGEPVRSGAARAQAAPLSHASRARPAYSLRLTPGFRAFSEASPTSRTTTISWLGRTVTLLPYIPCAE